jgi:hypothetical protein
MNDSLIGQFVWFLQGEEQKIGRIMLAVDLDHFLVRMCTDGIPSHNQIMSVADLADLLLFNSREELDEFRAWCTEDRPPLKLVRTDDKGPAARWAMTPRVAE